MILPSLAALLLAQVGEAEAALFLLPPRLCGSAELDPSTVHASTEAPPGGAFWLRRSDVGSDLAGALSLVDGTGARTEALVVYRARESIAVGAPDDALTGQVFSLEEDGALVPGLALRVVAPAEEAPTLEVATPVAAEPVATTCDDALCSLDGSAPRLPTFDVAYSGGPALLDVVVLEPGFFFDDLSPRTVESRLLPSADEGLVRVEAGPAVLSEGPVDVVFRFRGLDGRTVLHEELVAVSDVPDAEGGTPAPPCAPPCERDACGFGCAGLLPVFLGGLSLRGLRRRGKSAR